MSRTKMNLATRFMTRSFIWLAKKSKHPIIERIKDIFAPTILIIPKSKIKKVIKKSLTIEISDTEAFDIHVIVVGRP